MTFLFKKRSNFFVFFLAFILAIYTPSTLSENAPDTIHDKDILTYLQEVINWRQSIMNADLTLDNARVSLLQDALKSNSQKVLKKSFDFAHAESMLIEESQSKNIQNSSNQHTVLLGKIEESKQRISDLEQQINQISSKLLKKKKCRFNCST